MVSKGHIRTQSIRGRAMPSVGRFLLLSYPAMIRLGLSGAMHRRVRAVREG